MRRWILPNEARAADERAATTGPSLIERLLWICPIVSIAAIAVFLWVFGLTLWTAVAAGVLLGCPIAVAWVLIAERRDSAQRSLGHGDQ